MPFAENISGIKEYINSENIHWWLLILHHELAQLEESEIEWNITQGYQKAKQDDIEFFLLYGSLKKGDFHAREIDHAKEQIILNATFADKNKDEIRIYIQKWHKTLVEQFYEITEEITKKNNNQNEENIFQKIVTNKKDLLQQYLMFFQQERMKLDILAYAKHHPLTENLLLYFVKRELAKNSIEYLRYEEKKIVFSLLLDIEITLHNKDYIALRYSNLPELHEKKAWYKKYYYYSIYYDTGSEREVQLSDVQALYLDKISKPSTHQHPSSEKSEPLAEINARIRYEQHSKHEKEVEQIREDRKLKKELTKKNELLEDPVGYVYLAKELEVLFILTPNEVDEFDQVIRSEIDVYDRKLIVPNNYRHDVINKAKSYIRPYFENVMTINQRVNELFNEDKNINNLSSDEKTKYLIKYGRNYLNEYKEKQINNDLNNDNKVHVHVNFQPKYNKFNIKNILKKYISRKNILLMGFISSCILTAALLICGVMPGIAFAAGIFLGLIISYGLHLTNNCKHYSVISNDEQSLLDQNESKNDQVNQSTMRMLRRLNNNKQSSKNIILEDLLEPENVIENHAGQTHPIFEPLETNREVKRINLK